MKKRYAAFPILALLGGGCAFWLRLMQNRTGFEQGTGLPVAGNPYALALPALLGALCVGFFLLALGLPGRREEGNAGPFRACFVGGTGLRMIPALGVFLWIFSGGYGIYAGLAAGASRWELIQGGLTLVSGVCALPLVSGSVRREGETESPFNGNVLLVTVVTLVIRLVITYREDSVNPALTAYYVDLLALALVLLCLYRTASYAFGDGRTRLFAVYAAGAAVVSMATLADSHTAAARLFYAGGALISLGLLMLRMNALSGARSPEEASGGEPGESPA